MSDYMDLDEAIAHALEVAERKEREANHYKNKPPYSCDFGNKGGEACKCAKEYRQLAKWLQELKEYRLRADDGK
jgi:hypothetical protein